MALPQRTDARGHLGFAQEGDEIPFTVRRIFYLYGIPPGATRGGHAHLEQHQMLVMLSGSCVVTVDDGAARTQIALTTPATGLYVPPLLWLELDRFDPGAVCLVLTSARFDESDYVRDYRRFRELVPEGRRPC